MLPFQLPDARDPTPPTRADIERLANALERLTDEVRTKLDVQFKRMAQLQADLDLIRSAWTKVKPKDS